MSLDFSRDFKPCYGEAVQLDRDILRLTVNNPSAFTFMGTNTYILGDQSCLVIDPGPEDKDHFDNIMKALAGRPLTHILLTHTHQDHSPGARALKAVTGAPTLAMGPHQLYSSSYLPHRAGLDASIDTQFSPDLILCDGHKIAFDSGSLEVVATPGHTSNHCCFALEERNILFSGDHVMGWSTSIVAPPDGKMQDYILSLEKLQKRQESLYYSGHGGPVENAHDFVTQLLQHRLDREQSILENLEISPKSALELVDEMYQGLGAGLRYAAALSVLAQIEWLIDKKMIASPDQLDFETPVSLQSI